MRKGTISLALVGLMALALGGTRVVAGTSGTDDARAALARAAKALNAGDARTARVEGLNAIKADPDWAAAHVVQARALLALDDGVNAQAELVRARTLGAGSAETRHLMAQALLMQGDAQAALVEASADDIPQAHLLAALRIRAQAQLLVGDGQSAVTTLDQALKMAPDDARTWVVTSTLRNALGDEAGAILASERAVALAPKSVEALTARAMMVRSQFGLKASLPWFGQALSIDEKAVPALIEYAATLADMGQAQRALSVSRRALALDPGNPRAFMIQAVIAARAGHYDLSRSLLRRTDGRLDSEPATMLLTGIVNLGTGNAVQAADSFQALVQVQPRNQQARLLWGRALFLAGDYDDAADVLAPLADRPDADTYTLTLMARVQEKRGDQMASADLLDRANGGGGGSVPFAQDGPLPPVDSAASVANVAWIRAALTAGDGAGAISRARALAAANPGAPAAQMVLGDALLATGQAAAAANAYERAGTIRFSQEVALRIVRAWNLAGDGARASRALNLFLEQNPANVAAQQLAAGYYLDAGQPQRAVALLETLRRRIGNNDARLMTELARGWLDAGDDARALVYARHAYRLAPANPAVADMWGWALFRANGATQSAIDVMEKAVALAPDQPIVRLHIGEVYAAAGRKEDARDALQMAANAPGFSGRNEARDLLSGL